MPTSFNFAQRTTDSREISSKVSDHNVTAMSCNLPKRIIRFFPRLYYNIARAVSREPLHPNGGFCKQDHFPHRNHAIESWYFSGALACDKRAGPLGVNVTFFRIKSPCEGRILHVSLCDAQNRTFDYHKVAVCPSLKRPASDSEVISVKKSCLRTASDALTLRVEDLGIHKGDTGKSHATQQPRHHPDGRRGASLLLFVPGL